MSGVTNCSTKYVALNIKNNSLADGTSTYRGIYTLFPNQPQGFDVTFLWNNTVIGNKEDCVDTNSSTVFAQNRCGVTKGGLYNVQSRFWTVAANGQWNGSATNPTEYDSNFLFGWDRATFDHNITVPGYPLAVYSDTSASTRNKTAIGLGSDSVIWKALVHEGYLAGSPKQIGIYMGSRSQLHGVDGEIIFGGYDISRVNGTWTWFPIGRRYSGLDCPLQVLIEDVVLTNANGSQSLVVDPASKTPACLDPIQSPFTLSSTLFERWANYTQRPTTDPTDGSPPWKDNLYPKELESLIGDLVVKISNDHAQTYESVIPHFEIVGQQRGADERARYAVTNTSRLTASVRSPVNAFTHTPLLGGRFLSQNYLVVDYDRGVFGLAPAIIGPRNPSDRRVLSRCSTQQSHQGTWPKIVGPVVGALVIVSMLFLGLWLNRRNKRNSRDSASSPDENLQVQERTLSRHGSTLPIMASPGDASSSWIAHEAMSNARPSELRADSDTQELQNTPLAIAEADSRPAVKTW